jgi:uncharacterized DUF497 family protein
MEIEFDPAKDAENRRKHDGLSLSLAAALDWDYAVSMEDRRFAYDEIRMNATVPKGNVLYHLTYTERGSALRVITLRYASNTEKKRYVQGNR